MQGAQQWYMAIGGHQVGPVSQEEILANLRNGSIDKDTLVFTSGMASWQPLKDVPVFAAFVSAPAAGVLVPPPPSASGRRAHDIDFTIHGSEMQFVEVELDPGEAAIAEAGSMMYMTDGINLETIFGDGSRAQSAGVLDALLGAGKRLLTGESLFMTVFTNTGQGKHRVAFAAPYAGKILPMDLHAIGGHLVCQKDSFLCAARGVSVGIAFQKKIGAGLFGGEGFIMQRLEGDGYVFVHVGGCVVERVLGDGEELHVDTGCVAAMTPDVDFDIVRAGSIKSMVFGGEGVFFAQLRGPGTVWIQSLPFSRLAGRVLANARGLGGKDEGSLLGNVFGGDSD